MTSPIVEAVLWMGAGALLTLAVLRWRPRRTFGLDITEALKRSK